MIPSRLQQLSECKSTLEVLKVQAGALDEELRECLKDGAKRCDALIARERSTGGEECEPWEAR